MTAFAIDFHRTCAVVCGDSLGYIPNRQQVVPIGFVSKVLQLPQQRAVLFARGQHEIGVRAVMTLGVAPHILSIEDAAFALPDMLREITLQDRFDQDIADYLSVGLAEVVLLGWSETEKRMRFWQFLNYRDYVPEDDGGKLYGVHSFPRLPAKYMPRIIGNATNEQLVEIIQAAGRFFENEPASNCGMRVGGEVLSVEITPEGMTHRVLHRFASYEEMRHASAAVRGRILRGDMDVEGVVAAGLVPMAEVVDTWTGEPMQPAQAAPVAPQAAEQPMTRQQRRAAEREAAKGRRAA